MRGRRPSGPEYVDLLPGSDLAKQRARILLETLAGQCRVLEACDRLGISEPRFHQLRIHMLENAIDSLEPATLGRPPRSTTPEQQEIARLTERLADMEVELRAAHARAEIALVLPNAVPDKQADNHQDHEKKTRSPKSRRRSSHNRPPGSRKNT